MNRPTQTKALEVHGISKCFTGITAVDNVSFKVKEGEVLCLLGDNGAGKSTLIKILSGATQPTSGRIILDGEPIVLTSPREAKSFGIATVQQEVGTIDLLNIARNFFLGSELTKGRGPFAYLDKKRMNSIVLNQIKQLGIRRIQSSSQLCGVMSGGERQALAIARAIYFGGHVLILDEPTSALGVKQSEIVLQQISRARSNGIIVIFITHNVKHALNVGDKFVVLNHGEKAAEFQSEEKSRDEIIELMSGNVNFASPNE